MTRPILLTALCATLAACGSDVRVPVPPVAPEARYSIPYGTVEVRDVLLPDYAQAQDIFVEEAGGVLTSEGGLLWADLPARAATLELTQSLSTVTGARVASEPWPFDDYADVRVEVRVTEFVASARTNEFRLAGQYYVATFDAEGRDRARDFRIAVPLAPEFGPGNIAVARSQAMTQLGVEIARDGLR